MFVLPNSRIAVANRRTMGSASGSPYLLDLETGEATLLFEQNVVDIKYTSGFLVWALTNGNLEAQPFDPATRRVSGSAST